MEENRSGAFRSSTRRCCCGIIAQADVALMARENEVGEMVREVSRDSR